MLPPFAAVPEPYCFYVDVGPQVIEMPVGPGRNVQVMVHPGADATGAEGAPDVNVEPVLKAHAAEPTNADFGGRGR
jgi:hypothetical protein